jgi:predicted helicase
MSPLHRILAKYRATSQTEREKGSYFEELIHTYFRHEPRFADLYSDVWLYADWVKEIGTPEFGISGRDTGIDLVARTACTKELAGTNTRVLFLVPSLNLLSQTLTEWTQESTIPLHSFAVCSDVKLLHIVQDRAFRPCAKKVEWACKQFAA